MPTTQQLQTAAVMRAQGASYRDIGAAVNVDYSQIAKTLKKDELQQLIRQAQTDLITGSLTTAIQNQADKIKYSGLIAKKIAERIDDKADKDNPATALPEGSIKLMELGHDAEKQLLQSVGVHNSHTQSITLNQIMIDARSEMSPAVEALLVRHFTEDVQEAEVVDK